MREIEKSRYNSRYEGIRVPGLTHYLAKRLRWNEVNIIAIFGCDNVEKGNQIWKSEEEGKCERCYTNVETMEHLLSGCGLEGRNNWSREGLLNELGSDINEMRRIFERRRELCIL